MRKKGMNDARIEGDVAYLALTNIRGEVVAETMVDVADLALLREDGRRWCYWVNRSGAPHVGYRGNDKARRLQLHRFLMTPPDDLVVDHINGNRLDNRRSNLRVVTQQENMRNLKNPRASATRVRNVTRRPGRHPFRVELRSAGTVAFRCACKTLNIARITAQMARVSLWGKEAA